MFQDSVCSLFWDHFFFGYFSEEEHEFDCEIKASRREEYETTILSNPLFNDKFVNPVPPNMQEGVYLTEVEVAEVAKVYMGMVSLPCMHVNQQLCNDDADFRPEGPFIPKNDCLTFLFHMYILARRPRNFRRISQLVFWLNDPYLTKVFVDVVVKLEYKTQ